MSSMERRPPKWHKPRSALVTSLAIGGWVCGGAAAFGEVQMVLFGGICAGAGLLIYGMDCGMQKLINGRIRPEEVLWTDFQWAVSVTLAAVVLGLAAPLYVT